MWNIVQLEPSCRIDVQNLFKIWIKRKENKSILEKRGMTKKKYEWLRVNIFLYYEINFRLT